MLVSPSAKGSSPPLPGERRAAYDVQGAIEYLSMKVGLVALVLGVMHFLNLAIFSKMRKNAVEPAEHHPRRSQYPEAIPARYERVR